MHRAVLTQAAIATQQPPDRGRIRGARPWRKVNAGFLLGTLRWARLASTAEQTSKPRPVQQLQQLWNSAWHGAKDAVAPRPYIKISKVTCRHPWTTPSVVKLIHRRRRAHRRLRRAHRMAQLAPSATADAAQAADRIAEMELELQALASVTKKAITGARRRYFARKRASLATGLSSRQGWQFVNELLGRESKARAQPPCTPDALNDAFLAKPAKLREEMHRRRQRVPPNEEMAKCGIHRPEAPFVREKRAEAKKSIAEQQALAQRLQLATFRPVAAGDVRRVARKAAATWAAGEDDIPMGILRRLIQAEQVEEESGQHDALKSYPPPLSIC